MDDDGPGRRRAADRRVTLPSGEPAENEAEAAVERAAAALGFVLPPDCRPGVAAAFLALSEHRRRVAGQ